MIVLDSINKSLTVVATAKTTTDPDFEADWEDERTGLLLSGNNNGTLNGVTTVTLVAAPGDNVRRRIRHVAIQNRDTVAATVTVSLTDTAVARQIVKATLAVGETLVLP